LTTLQPDDQPRLLHALQTIGNSQMDLYLGDLDPVAIDSQIIAQLQQRGIAAPTHYAEWLASNGHYQLLQLDDHSEWVLRWGEIDQQRVHLHPARYSPLSVRVRAPVLRSAYAIMVWQGWYGGDLFDLQLINRVRTAWLHLSPIAKLPPNDGLAALLSLLRELNQPN